MKIKSFIMPALIAAVTLSSSQLFSMERLLYHPTSASGEAYTSLAGSKAALVFTPVEDEAAQLLMDLLEDTLTDNHFHSKQTAESPAGDKKISLKLQPYPATLIRSDYISRTPQDALERFSRPTLEFTASAAEGTEEDAEGELSRSSSPAPAYRDGSQPLRLQAFASHNQKPCFPFLIYVSMSQWHDLKSLRFLQHPTIVDSYHADLFRECLFSLEVEGCGLTYLDNADFKGYRNITMLNLHNNSIEKLDNSLPRDTSERPLHSLQELCLDDNLLRSLDNFFETSFPWLEKLSLAQNNIQELPGGCLSGLIMLAYLDLEGNLMRSKGLSVESFKGVGASSRFFNLRINLANNALTDFPLLQQVKERLIEINLDDNPVVEISDDIADCNILRRVSLIKTDRPAEESATLEATIRSYCPAGCKIILHAPQPVDAADDGYVTP